MKPVKKASCAEIKLTKVQAAYTGKKFLASPLDIYFPLQ